MRILLRFHLQHYDGHIIPLRRIAGEVLHRVDQVVNQRLRRQILSTRLPDRLRRALEAEDLLLLIRRFGDAV